MPFEGESPEDIQILFQHAAANIRQAEPRLAQKIEEIAKKLAPVNRAREPQRPPGTFRDSLIATITQSRAASGQFAEGFDIEVSSNDDPVAMFIMRGTKEHDIPRGEPYKVGHLRYYTEDGQLHFSRQVHHPGTKPNPFMDKADQEITSYMDNLIDGALREL